MGFKKTVRRRRPVLLLAIEDWLLTQKPYWSDAKWQEWRDSTQDKSSAGPQRAGSASGSSGGSRCKWFVSFERVKALRRWLPQIEVRWWSRFDTDIQNALSQVCRLPTFCACNTLQMLSLDEYRSCPVIFLEEVHKLHESVMYFAQQQLPLAFLHVRLSSFFPNPISAVDEFLHDMRRRFLTLSVHLHPEYAKQPVDRINHINHIAKVRVRIPVHRIRQDFQLAKVLIHHPKLHVYLQHLQKHPRAITVTFPDTSDTNTTNTTNNTTSTTNHNIIKTMRLAKKVILQYPATLPTSISPTTISVVPVSASAPLIWLDVDGVINVVNPFVRESFQQEFSDATTVMGYANGKTFYSYYSPTVVAKINAWSQVAEIRWHTSWGYHARYRLAPLLGLRDFAVCPFPRRRTRYAQVHPARDLRRPIIWIDDDSLDDNVRALTEAPVLLIRPQFFLSRTDMNLVDEFLASL